MRFQPTRLPIVRGRLAPETDAIRCGHKYVANAKTKRSTLLGRVSSFELLFLIR
jgi:hypothetical protein